MRQIVGIGETIVDIIFRDNKPVSANPGGSTFNSFISLGRMGQNGLFLSEVGNDRLGRLVRECLRTNGLTDRYVDELPGGKTPLAIAFLNEKNDAEYSFYKDYRNQRLSTDFPELQRDDVVLFGSYFSLNKQIRPRVEKLLGLARKSGAIVYYDPNFRATHLAEVPELMSVLEENFAFSDVVRGSDEDFFHIFGLKTAEDVYGKVRQFCPNLIYTQGSDGVTVCTPNFSKKYFAPKIKVVSTVGAGDSFNAGFIYGLMIRNIQKKDLPLLPESDWDELVRCAMAFSADVCGSLENYVSHDFARRFK